MTTVWILLGAVFAAWLIYQAIVVVRGNNYHAMVREAVIAEVGIAAVAYLQSPQIITQITNAFRRGDPASSAAIALIMHIRDATKDGTIVRQHAQAAIRWSQETGRPLHEFNDAQFLNDMGEDEDVLDNEEEGEEEEEESDEDKKDGVPTVATGTTENPFDSRNPRLARVFHALKDELEGWHGYSAAQVVHPSFRDAIEADYVRYQSPKIEGDITPEHLFNNIVSDAVNILLSCHETLSDRPDQHLQGIKVSLVVVLRVLFGSGPGYSKVIEADPQVITLALLTRIMTEYQAAVQSKSESAFVQGASRAVTEFLRRCEAAYGAPSKKAISPNEPNAASRKSLR